VVVRTEIDYRCAAKLADRLVIEGWLDKLDRARFWCAFRIVRPRDEALIAECRQMLALIDLPAGKLLRLPENWDKYREANSHSEPAAGERAGRTT
jgi:acyl-CoA thioesterase FadM